MVSRTAGRVTPRCDRWEHRGVIARARAGMVVGVHAALGLLLGCAHTGTVATERTVGTAAQLDWMDFEAARDGSWVVLSQADAVDGPLRDIPMELHRFDPVFGLKLFLGDRPGVAIEHPRVSPNDRWLVVEREGRLQLVDAPAARWIDLASGFDGIADHSLGWERPVEPSARTELNWTNPWCYTDFSADGDTLLFVDAGEERHRVVVRGLPEGEEHVIDPGPGVLSWAKLMPAGDAVVLGMTVFDEGPPAPEVSWPYPFDEAPRCTRPHQLAKGARHVTRVIGLDGQELGRRPGEYDPMGPGLIQPTAERGLSWWRPDLDRDTVIPPCVGYIVLVDPVRPRMLQLCDVDMEDYASGRLRLEQFEQRVDLGPMQLESGFAQAEDGRFIVLGSAEGPLVIDMDTPGRIGLPDGGRVVGIAAGRVLVQKERRGRRSWRPRPTRVEIVDLQSLATLETFWAHVGNFDRAVGPGPVVAHGRVLIDLEHATVLGTLPDEPDVVTPEGLALVIDPETKQPGRDRLRRGPLRWFALAR